MTLVPSEIDGPVATPTLNRQDERNAMSDAVVAALDRAFRDLPDEVRAVILTGPGGHFCAGLDLAEHVERAAEEGLRAVLERRAAPFR